MQKETKGAYKQRIIKDYIKKPFKKGDYPLVWGFLTQFDFGSDNEKLESLRSELITCGVGSHKQSIKHQYKNIAQKLRVFVETVKNKELKTI